MPKIIENLKSRLVDEARAQVQQVGYGGVTMRSVAKACGVGVGTVYNYFPSKDSLLAAYMLRDWQHCVQVIHERSLVAQSYAPVLRCIYDELCRFVLEHPGVLRDEAAAPAFQKSFAQYHAVLRQQLAEPLRKFCESDFAAEFAAEALLTWTIAGKDYELIFAQLDRLFPARLSERNDLN